MNRLTLVLVILVFGSCSKPEPDPASPSYEHALASSMVKCDGADLGWLRDIIKLAETDFHYQGAIYAIPVEGRTVFLHQPWISSCFACIVYDCNGDRLGPTDVDQNEVVAGAQAENLIYSTYQ